MPFLSVEVFCVSREWGSRGAALVGRGSGRGGGRGSWKEIVRVAPNTIQNLGYPWICVQLCVCDAVWLCQWLCVNVVLRYYK